MSLERPDLSLVVPAFDEEGNIALLCDGIEKALEGRDWECLLVDDASRDRTREEMLKARARNPRFRVLSKTGWKGKSSSLLAGFAEARGRLIATIDADLQDDPLDLARAIDALEKEGCDAINGWRQKRDDSFVKRLSSKIGNGLRRRLLGSSIRDAGTGIRVFKRECLEALVPFEGVHRYFSEMLELHGFRIVEIPVDHHRRHAGVAKYGVANRLGRGIADLMAVRWLQRRIARFRSEEILE